MSVAEATAPARQGPAIPVRAGLAASARLLASELRLIATRRRNIVGLAILCVVPIVLAIVMAVSQPSGQSGPPFFSVVYGNGLFVVLATLGVEAVVFLPMAMCILAGDAIAGEANGGTLRYLLTVPVGRSRLLAVKFTSLIIGAFVGVFAVALVAAGMGLMLFGAGDMLVLSGQTVDFANAAGRVALVCVYMSLVLIAVCALGLFFSTLTEQPIAAAVGTLMWVILDQVLGSISVLDWLHPFLLTQYWPEWVGLMREPVSLSGMGTGLVSVAVYAAVFYSAAWARLTTKDITS